MKKISDLTEKRWRTKYYRDAYGNRIPEKEEYTAYRPVKSVKAGPRFGHFIIDTICFQILSYLVNYIFAMSTVDHSNRISITIAFISLNVNLLLYPCYYFIFEAIWQKTPGKFLTRCSVVNEYGQKPELTTIAARSLIRLVPFEAFSCLGDNYSHGWHDRWTKTWVIPDEELEILRKMQAEQGDLID